MHQKYNKKSCVMISLVMHGEMFDTDYVTQKTGILPNYIRQKNDLLKSGKKFGHTEWGFTTEWLEIMDLNDALIMHLSTISGKIPELKQVSLNCNAHWDLCIGLKIWNEEKPAMVFSREIIQVLAELNAEIGIDYYCYGFENTEDHTH